MRPVDDVRSARHTLRSPAHITFAIFACAMLAYGAALAGTFVYDDFHSVRDNEAVRSLTNVPSFFVDPGMFSVTGARMYRPVLLVTFAVDHAVGGGAALAFKITDLLIHAACAAMVYSLARSLRAGQRRAVFAGLLFAVHPLASEAVNSVASRSDQLFTLGMLLALRLHLGAIRGSRWALLGTAAATALACGAKETGVVVPAILVVLELVHGLRRGPRVGAAFLRVVPAVAVVAVYLWARRVLLGIATVAVPKLSNGGGDVFLGAGRDLVTQWTAMGGILPRFLAQTAAPVGLSADPYVSFDRAPTDPWVVAGWATVLLLTAIGLSAPRRRQGAFVGTCAAWAVALPWVAIPLNSPANEHRFYGSLAALAVVIGTTMPRGWLRVRPGRLALVAVLAMFGAVAATRCLVYRDPRLLWQDTLAGNPASAAGLRGFAQAHQDDAKTALRAGDHETAVREIREAIDYAYRALAIVPRNLEVLKGLVRYQLALGAEYGEPMLAVVHAEQLTETRPKDPFGRVQLSRALAQAGVATGDTSFFERADAVAMSILEIAEPKGLVYRVAAEAWVAAGDLDRALARLDESVARGLDHSTVRLDRADVLLRQGRGADAFAEAQRVLAASPFDRRALGIVDRARAMPRPR